MCLKFKNFHFFHEFLQLDKFECADFKYDNIIFKFQPINTQNRHLGLKFKDLNFCTKFYNKTNSKTLISNMTIFFFKFQSKNTQVRHFWSKIPSRHFVQGIFWPKFRNFWFSRNFAIRQIWRCWFPTWQYCVFQIPAKKTPNKTFLGPNIYFRHFHYFMKFWN